MMRARDHRCVFVGQRADHLHHASGRDGAGRYLDPLLVVPLTRRQHVVEHTSWSVLGIADGSVIAPDLLRLRRTGHLLVRLGVHHEGRTVQLPPLFVVELGRLLNRLAEERELGQ